MKRIMRYLAAALLGVILMANPVSAREIVYWYHNDHLGTPQVITNKTGNKVWEAEYRPFGEATANEDPDADGWQVVNNIRFPGQYHDAESGLHYNWHREYEPETGRYLETDPSGLDGGPNLYAYASGNPSNYRDPTGEVAIPIPWPAIEPIVDRLPGLVGGIIGAIIGAVIGDTINRDCDSPCPPCRLVDGTIVRLGQIGYREDTHKLHNKHNIVGNTHLHVAECHQIPRPGNCNCFWVHIRVNGDYYVQPPPQPGWIRMQDFVNPPPG